MFEKVADEIAATETPVPVAELAERTGLSDPRLTAVLNRLTDAGVLDLDGAGVVTPGEVDADAGVAEAVDADSGAAEDTPFPPGCAVRHSEWGDGSVLRIEDGERLVVLFDRVGYKTLSLAVVTDSDVLTRLA